MGLVRLGAKKIELGDWDPVNKTSDNWVEVPVYDGTFQMTEPQPNVTSHKQQGRTAARVRRAVSEDIQIVFQLMDTDPAALALAMGGTVTPVNGADVYHHPKSRGEVVKSLKITVEDDSIITVPAFSHYARINFDTSTERIHLMDVDGVVTDTGDDNMADFTWGDPEPVIP